MNSILNKVTRIFIGMTAMFAAWQCNTPKDWSDPKDNTSPGPVTNVRVTNLNGGALIEYDRWRYFSVFATAQVLRKPHCTV